MATRRSCIISRALDKSINTAPPKLFLSKTTHANKEIDNYLCNLLFDSYFFIFTSVFQRITYFAQRSFVLARRFLGYQENFLFFSISLKRLCKTPNEASELIFNILGGIMLLVIAFLGLTSLLMEVVNVN